MAQPSVQIITNEARVHGSEETLRRHSMYAGKSNASQQRLRKSSIKKR